MRFDVCLNLHFAKWFWDVMFKFDQQTKRKLLKFVTGIDRGKKYLNVLMNGLL
jgi:hypothetical protein